MKMSDPRYQHQSWLVRRWRDRHNLCIPLTAIRVWVDEQRGLNGGPGRSRMSFSNCWSLACGIADGKKQHWFYGTELTHNLLTKDENV
jgi:hypothetical protein